MRTLRRQELETDSIGAEYTPDFAVQLRVNRGDSRSSTTANSLQEVVENSNSAALVMTLPWWHKAGYKFDASISEVGESLEATRYEIQKLRLIRDIYVTYFEVLLQKEKVWIQQRFTETSKLRLDNAKKKYRLGTSSEWNILNEESNYLSKLSSYHDARTAFLSSLNQLSQLTGVNYPHDVKFDDGLIFTSYRDFIQQVMALTTDFGADPQVKEIEFQLQQKEIEVEKISDSKWTPSLSLRAIYYDENSEGDGADADSTRTVVGASLNLPIPVFTSGDQQTATVLHEIEDLKADIIELKREKMNQVASRKRIIKVLGEYLETLTLLVEKKKQEAKSAKKSFDIGRLTNLELQNLENLQIQSEEKYYETLFDVRQNYAELCLLLGIASMSPNL
ncbi:hypothetical protein GCM10022277_07400 [Litoribacillus peritrichatus]|uniref:Outer membrane efflux protein n=2 Tax=Litoribacillus peritrichatus TaxID=718191 RepID=A0ABP7M9L1_9GAMM